MVVLSSTMERPELVSKKTREILNKAAVYSKNPSIIITSGWRSPSRQANAMFENLSKGDRIRYAAAGREVMKVYNENAKKHKEEVIELMIKKINELSERGQRVSLHCVSDAEYRKLNIVDVSKHIPNPRDFVKELVKEDAVVRVITPISSDYNNKKVSVDVSEPCIHIEIKQ